MDQVKIAAQLQNPNILKIFGIGKVDATYYVSYEFVEGKSLQAGPRPLPAGGLSLSRSTTPSSSRARSRVPSSTPTDARTTREPGRSTAS